MRFISREDTAFYYGRLVMKVAESLAPKGKVYKDLGDKKRKMLVEQAFTVVYNLNNDEPGMVILKTLAERE